MEGKPGKYKGHGRKRQGGPMRWWTASRVKDNDGRVKGSMCTAGEVENTKQEFGIR